MDINFFHHHKVELEGADRQMLMGIQLSLDSLHYKLNLIMAANEQLKTILDQINDATSKAAGSAQAVQSRLDNLTQKLQDASVDPALLAEAQAISDHIGALGGSLEAMGKDPNAVVPVAVPEVSETPVTTPTADATSNTVDPSTPVATTDGGTVSSTDATPIVDTTTDAGTSPVADTTPVTQAHPGNGSLI